METITIKVDEEVAQFYQNADLYQQQKIQSIFNDLLKQIIEQKTLEQLIEEMQTQAKHNGLTQAILDQILDNE